jgi:hypothetical protein
VVCSTHGRDEKGIQSFWSENLKGRKYSEDPDVDGRIILEWILGKYERCWEVVDWFHLAKDKDQWRGGHSNEPAGSINGGEFLN